MGEGKALLPWRSRRKSVLLDGLHGISMVHHHQATSGNGSVSNGASRSTLWSEAADTQELLLKTAPDPQSFRLWDSIFLKKLWVQRPAWLRISAAQCHGDRHLPDRVANILTSVPFVLIGLQAPRKRFADKMYADSIVGVGLASGFYHCSKGNARRLFRWGDYTAIATSTLFLSRALRQDDSKLLYAASAVCLPFQPLLVSALHVGLMEITFAQRAQMEPHLKKAHALHAASSLVGCALFVADDVFPDTPFLHAAWHVAAAVGVASCTKLLED